MSRTLKGAICKNQKLLVHSNTCGRSQRKSASCCSRSRLCSRYIDMNEHRSKQWGDTRQLTHNITLYFTCLAVMLADQTKVSPWINADSSAGFSCLSPPTRRKRGGGGETATPGRDDNVTRCGASSLHTTRETSVGLEERQHLFLQKRPMHIH